ncbi:MAG: RHS repeat-associated core domain-containing protein [Candidatus Micrarchaeota archaeon]
MRAKKQAGRSFRLGRRASRVVAGVSLLVIVWVLLDAGGLRGLVGSVGLLLAPGASSGAGDLGEAVASPPPADSGAFGGVQGALAETKLSTTTYFYGNGVVSSRRGGVSTYFHRDYLDSVRLQSDSSGQKRFASRTSPFGSDVFVSGGAAGAGNAYKFTGKESDVGSGLYYYGARYYSPAAGRFSAVDPASSGSVSPYVYAANNPLKFVDPTGGKPVAAVLVSTYAADHNGAYSDEMLRLTINELSSRFDVYYVRGGGFQNAIYDAYSRSGGRNVDLFVGMWHGGKGGLGLPGDFRGGFNPSSFSRWIRPDADKLPINPGAACVLQSCRGADPGTNGVSQADLFLSAVPQFGSVFSSETDVFGPPVIYKSHPMANGGMLVKMGKGHEGIPPSGFGTTRLSSILLDVDLFFFFRQRRNLLGFNDCVPKKARWNR